jgi:hypothetical protein
MLTWTQRHCKLDRPHYDAITQDAIIQQTVDVAPLNYQTVLF